MNNNKLSDMINYYNHEVKPLDDEWTSLASGLNKVSSSDYDSYVSKMDSVENKLIEKDELGRKKFGDAWDDGFYGANPKYK